MLATPTTLISLLRIVALGWQQKAVTDNARQIGLLGREFYKRLADYTEHLENMGKHLTQAVTAYNQGVGSFERRVLVSARKFKEYDPGISRESSEDGIGKELGAEISEIDVSVRSLKETKKKTTPKS
jgi:DNA recombination protein RmuC